LLRKTANAPKVILILYKQRNCISNVKEIYLITTQLPIQLYTAQPM